MYITDGVKGEESATWWMMELRLASTYRGLQSLRIDHRWPALYTKLGNRHYTAFHVLQNCFHVADEETKEKRY